MRAGGGLRSAISGLRGVMMGAMTYIQKTVRGVGIGTCRSLCRRALAVAQEVCIAHDPLGSKMFCLPVCVCVPVGQGACMRNDASCLRSILVKCACLLAGSHGGMVPTESEQHDARLLACGCLLVRPFLNFLCSHLVGGVQESGVLDPL